ncbi:protein of unknown function [Candidatus Methylocalor cossyra]|uniref:Uncharacterized protein n=1 Tax=Candidatus Methylocalor cossyra TaxID=3108543 RepID=A0ABM9NFJ8_9GAMM
MGSIPKPVLQGRIAGLITRSLGHLPQREKSLSAWTARRQACYASCGTPGGGTRNPRTCAKPTPRG